MEVYANVLIIPLHAAMVIDLASYRGSRVSGLNVSLRECGLFMEKNKKQKNETPTSEKWRKKTKTIAKLNINKRYITHLYCG